MEQWIYIILFLTLTAVAVGVVIWSEERVQ